MSLPSAHVFSSLVFLSVLLSFDSLTAAYLTCVMRLCWPVCLRRYWSRVQAYRASDNKVEEPVYQLSRAA